MDIEDAEKLSRLMIRLSSNLNQSVAYVRDHCSEAEFESYRSAVGKVMGDIYLEIEEKIWREHPSLRPEEMGGPFKVDESVYQPHFYLYGPGGGVT
jgi:hypothetical protein